MKALRTFIEVGSQHGALFFPMLAFIILLGALWGVFCLLTGREHTGVIT